MADGPPARPHLVRLPLLAEALPFQRLVLEELAGHFLDLPNDPGGEPLYCIFERFAAHILGGGGRRARRGDVPVTPGLHRNSLPPFAAL